MHSLKTRDWTITPGQCVTYSLAGIIISIIALFVALTISGRAQQGIEGAPSALTVTDLSMTTGFLSYGSTVNITASPMQFQGQQPLTTGYNEISTVGTRDNAATAPPAMEGRSLTIANVGPRRVQIFPFADDAFGPTAVVDASYFIEPGNCVHFIGRDDVRWSIASTTALGNWIDAPFSAGDFTASGSMTWTVEAGDVIFYRYMVLGNTMWMTWFIDNTTVGGSLSNVLRLAVPGGYEVDGPTRGVYRRRESATFAHAFLTAAAGDAFVELRMFDNINWVAATNSTDVEGSAAFPIVVP